MNFYLFIFLIFDSLHQIFKKASRRKWGKTDSARCLRAPVREDLQGKQHFHHSAAAQVAQTDAGAAMMTHSVRDWLHLWE